MAEAARLGPLERRGRRRFPVWTPAHDALLGCASDEALAVEWGLISDQVWRRRNLLNIPPFGTAGPGVIRWTAKMIGDLGRMTDRAFAAAYGISPGSASLKRSALKKPRVPHPRATVWTPRMLKLLGQHQDKECARLLGLSPMTIRTKRKELGVPTRYWTKVDWTSAAVRRLLGAKPDIEVAKILAVNAETVRIRRTALGIPPFHAVEWTPEVVRRLGSVPDRELAEELGLTPSAVSWNRRRRGIPSWDVRPHPGNKDNRARSNPLR